MSRTRTFIFGSVAIVALAAGASWVASGGLALAQQQSQGQDDDSGDRRDRRERRDRRDNGDRRRDRDDRRDDRETGTASAPATSAEAAPTTTSPATTAPSPTAPTTAPVAGSAVPATRPSDVPSNASSVPYGDSTASRSDGRRDDRGPGSPAAVSTGRREDFVARYAVVYEKNIFLRDRPTYFARGNEPRATPSGPSAPPRRPEESYVVTGIAMQEGRNVAFIENTSTGETKRVLDGETIADGTVISLDLDALEFELSGKRTRVAVGRNLAGEVVFTRPPTPAPPVAAAAASPAATPQPGGAAPFGAPPGGAAPGAAAVAAPGAVPAAAGALPTDPNNPNLSAEERMKLRRQQQGGR